MGALRASSPVHVPRGEEEEVRDEISDELREWAARHTSVKLGTQLACGPVEQIIAIADRIDREMMERPLAADGKPVVDGETLYDSDGREYHVNKLSQLVNVSTDTYSGTRRPETLTHERPDSLERISQELEDMSENFRVTDKDSFSALLDFADRIRKLAAKEDGNE